MTFALQIVFNNINLCFAPVLLQLTYPTLGTSFFCLHHSETHMLTRKSGLCRAKSSFKQYDLGQRFPTWVRVPPGVSEKS